MPLPGIKPVNLKSRILCHGHMNILTYNLCAESDKQANGNFSTRLPSVHGARSVQACSNNPTHNNACLSERLNISIHHMMQVYVA